MVVVRTVCPYNSLVEAGVINDFIMQILKLL